MTRGRLEVLSAVVLPIVELNAGDRASVKANLFGTDTPHERTGLITVTHAVCIYFPPPTLLSL